MAMTNINIRIDADKKLKAQELFSSLGLDMTTAINLFIQQSLEFNGIPFTIRKYNAETEAAFAEIEEMKKHPELYKQNKDLNILKKVIDILANDEILPDKYRDHLLIGNYKGKHECHLEPDWLLIYEYLEDELILFLTRTGSHSDLF